uniref:Aminotransferase-like plant mobile domain-containing protein n=2 Tax=Cucumis melo TaxID=3656 RepID=A0A9I9EFM6_CUCME
SYDKPTTRKQKKASHSKSTQNLDGSKIQAREWSSRENMLFAELEIRNDIKDEMYLAAFLSFWLCLFVFPQKGSFFRLEVFMAASLMVVGTIYSLTVSVLANIYHGLGLITKTSNPIGRMNFHCPMHYIHGWLAHYFSTHYPLPTEVRGPKMTNFFNEGKSIYFGEYEAQELIHNGARIQWHANLQNRNKHECMVDTHALSFLQTSYFVSMRSCYLSSRCGNTWIITSYSLYRFGRQFDFYHDIPNDIRGMSPVITLNNILYHWRICTRHNTLSELYLSVRSLEPCKHVTQRFTDWWATKHEAYFEDNRHHLVRSVILPLHSPNFPRIEGTTWVVKKIVWLRQ